MREKERERELEMCFFSFYAAASCSKTKGGIWDLRGFAKTHARASSRKGGRKNKQFRMNVGYVHMYTLCSNVLKWPRAQDGARKGVKATLTLGQ